MPQVSTFQDILAAEDDSIVYSVRATIKSLSKFFPAKDAKSQSFQVMTLTDGTRELKAIVKNREEIPAGLKNKRVLISSSHSEKGWHGVKSKDNEYDGATERVIWITKAANIEEEGVSAPAREAATPSQVSTPSPTPQNGSTGQKRANATPSGGQADLLNVRKRVGQIANLMTLALGAACYATKQTEEKWGVHFEPAQVQAIASTLYIDLSHGPWATMLPSGPMEKKAAPIAHQPPPPPPAPMPPPEPDPEPEPKPEPDPEFPPPSDDDVPF